MEYKDYYATLDVGRKASQDEIQKAYRKLARKYHPDINKGPEAEVRFKEINEAYEVLKDPDKRAKYDQFGSAWKQAQQTGAPPPGFEDIFSQFGFGGGGFQGTRRVEFDLGQGGGFSSFFEMLFGGGRPGGEWAGPFGAPASSPEARSRGGGDQEARIALSLDDASHGGKKEITLSDPESGKKRKLRVNLPPGMRPGQKIRLAGQGARRRNGRRGDLYLTIELLPHPGFRLEGSDLHTRIQVAPWEAALGGQAEVATLDGPVAVKLPAGSSSGRRIRLKGKGYPRKNGSRGDLFAEIRIVVPEKLTAQERELFEELATASKFEPRPS